MKDCNLKFIFTMSHIDGEKDLDSRARLRELELNVVEIDFHDEYGHELTESEMNATFRSAMKKLEESDFDEQETAVLIHYIGFTKATSCKAFREKVGDAPFVVYRGIETVCECDLYRYEGDELKTVFFFDKIAAPAAYLGKPYLINKLIEAHFNEVAVECDTDSLPSSLFAPVVSNVAVLDFQSLHDDPRYACYVGLKDRAIKSFRLTIQPGGTFLLDCKENSANRFGEQFAQDISRIGMSAFTSIVNYTIYAIIGTNLLLFVPSTAKGEYDCRVVQLNEDGYGIRDFLEDEYVEGFIVPKKSPEVKHPFDV